MNHRGAGLMGAGGSGSRRERASGSEEAVPETPFQVCLSERWGLGPDAKPLECPHL